MEQEVDKAIESLKRGEVILYPTDTIWGLGCDAMNEKAIRHIYSIKKREDSKSLIILVADERDILQYVAAPDLSVFDYLSEQPQPTTVIYDHALGLPDVLIADDGSIAIRIVQDIFCRQLIRRLRRPIVSTSANISGSTSPSTYNDITEEIKSGVDHIVQWRKDEKASSSPSRIIRWKEGKPIIIR